MADDPPTVDGDFTAFAAARWQRLVRAAYLLTGDHHEAEDLVQATLAKVYVRWDRVRTREYADAYVRRALVNEHLSRLRKRPDAGWGVWYASAPGSWPHPRSYTVEVFGADDSVIDTQTIAPAGISGPAAGAPYAVLP